MSRKIEDVKPKELRAKITDVQMLHIPYGIGEVVRFVINDDIYIDMKALGMGKLKDDV